MDLACSAAEVLVVVEGLPQVVDAALARLGAGVEKADDVRVEVPPERVEEPAVRVDLFGVLLLEAEDHLDGHEVVRVARVRLDERRLGRDREHRRVLEDVGCERASMRQLFDREAGSEGREEGRERGREGEAAHRPSPCRRPTSA